ncbi:MAG: hypothetical protein ACJAZH_001483 [Roseivirga sp.]|jgi:uncharacterized protein (TIGR01777 family)
MIVLISGGSGLVGEAITSILLQSNYTVRHLSRSVKKRADGVEVFAWDTDRGSLDEAAFKDLDYIINLAGASIAKRWTPKYKSEVLRSRLEGTRLLFDTASKLGTALKAFISASAVGYYPNSFSKTFNEDDAPGSNFLSLICEEWEREAFNFEQLGIKTFILRIGIVLSTKGGALPQMAMPVKFGLGAPLASGKQWMPWIHIEDLARQFVYCIESPGLKPGVYNAVGPKSASNKELTQAIAKSLKRPLFIPTVPAFALKLLLGEMSETVLASNRCSNQKIRSSGFKYKFLLLEDALADLYAK